MGMRDWALACLVLALPGPAAAVDPEVGGWRISRTVGECSMIKPHRYSADHIGNLHVAFFRGSIVLVLARPMNERKGSMASVSVGERWTGIGQLTAVEPDLVGITLAHTQGFLEALAAGSTLNVEFYTSKAVTLRLAGTAEAVPALLRCQRDAG